VIEVDARGLPCPRPVVETKKALEKIEAGRVKVLVDSYESCQNVERFAQSQGSTVSISEKDGVFCLDINKGHTSGDKGDKKESGTDVVLIASDRFGTGDDRLGEILMKAFLNTLWDTEPKPAKLLFINDGVRLTTEGSEVLDALRLLEKEGVDIFSCGTCLEFYHLQDKLAVGGVTNMYDTVVSLVSAGKVIKI
jgi:selenium metabolism protein YedF